MAPSTVEETLSGVWPDGPMTGQTHPVVRQLMAEDDWDALASNVPGCHYSQSTAWARVKAAIGWQSVRLAARAMNAPGVAAAQIFVRRVVGLGRIGYVPHAPLLDGCCTDDAGALVRGLVGALDDLDLHSVFVKPPVDGTSVAHELQHLGWHHSPIEVGPMATAHVDLRSGLEGVLARMGRHGRYNVRRALGASRIEVIESGRQGLAPFHRILLETGRRRGFDPEGYDYLAKVWDSFSETDSCVLFLSRLQASETAGLMLLCYGDTAVAWRAGWDGRFREERPNHALHWRAIGWATEHGYATYDFDGLDIRLAEAAAGGVPAPSDLQCSVGRFKLSFGGDVKFLPETLTIARRGGPAVTQAVLSRVLRRTTRNHIARHWVRA